MANNKYWLKILVGIGVILLGFAAGYGMLNQKVERNFEDIKLHNGKIDVCERAIIEQGQDLKHIKEAVDRIEKKL